MTGTKKVICPKMLQPQQRAENQVKQVPASYLAPNKPGYDTRAALLCGTGDGDAPISEPWNGAAQISYLTYGISSSSADKVKTMQCLDYLYGSADILNLLNWGRRCRLRSCRTEIISLTIRMERWQQHVSSGRRMAVI